MRLIVQIVSFAGTALSTVVIGHLFPGHIAGVVKVTGRLRHHLTLTSEIFTYTLNRSQGERNYTKRFRNCAKGDFNKAHFLLEIYHENI